jgi:hypothetical protein
MLQRDAPACTNRYSGREYPLPHYSRLPDAYIIKVMYS